MAADRKVKGWKESDFAYTISLFELFSPLDRGQWGSPQHITLLCVSVRRELHLTDITHINGAEPNPGDVSRIVIRSTRANGAAHNTLRCCVCPFGGNWTSSTKMKPGEQSGFCARSRVSAFWREA